MATYSNIGIKLITTGDESGTWGDTTNTNFSDILDEAIAKAVTYNIASDADVTLTVSDGVSSDARHAVIKFTSTTLSATRTVTFAPNTLQKTWLVINATTGGQSLTFKQGSAGATVTVPNGESAIIYSDGAGATNGAITKALDSFTNTKITTGTLNATTLDLTNLEVTNVKAKDGTAALTIADSTGKVTVSSELAVDNLNLSGNAITSTNSNGNIDLTPDGTGEVNITKVDIDAGAIDGTAIGANSASTGSFTNLTANSTINFTGATVTNGGTVTTVDINGGTIDGTTIGVTTPSTGAFTTLSATGNVTLGDATSDTITANGRFNTDLVPSTDNARDLGTSALQFKDVYGVQFLENGSNIVSQVDIGTAPNEVPLNQYLGTMSFQDATAITVGQIAADGVVSLDNAVTINESGADVDFRIEGDTDTDLFFVDASADYVGIGKNNPTSKLDVDGTIKDSAGSVRIIPAVGSKTASYTLATADVGKFVEVGSGGSITIPDATFAGGDAISIFNNTTGDITITCTITTAYIAGEDADKATMTLATRGVATILFISGTVCVVSGNVS